jgi:hypothetical protein
MVHFGFALTIALLKGIDQGEAARIRTARAFRP